MRDVVLGSFLIVSVVVTGYYIGSERKRPAERFVWIENRDSIENGTCWQGGCVDTQERVVVKALHCEQ